MQPWEHTTSTQSTAPCTTTCCVRYHDAPQTRQMDNDEDKDDKESFKEGIEVDYTRTSKEL